MRAHKYVLFDIHKAKDLEIGMTVSFSMSSTGVFYGKIAERSYESNGDITIILNNIIRDPSEEEFYPNKTDSITLHTSPEMLFKVRKPLSELISYEKPL